MQDKIKAYLELMRVYAWYKNIFIFLPLLFVKIPINFDTVVKLIIGFITLCLASSVYYIANDIFDYEKDKIHLEKKNRPLPSGRVSLLEAYLLLILLFILVFILTVFFFRNPYLLLLVFTLIFNTLLYSFYLSSVTAIDLVVISFNYVIKTLFGFIVLNLNIIPEALLFSYFLGMFIFCLKRYGDLYVLNITGVAYRKTLYDYANSIHIFIPLVTNLCISSFIAASIRVNENLLFILPLLLYFLFKSVILAYKNPREAINPAKIIFQPDVAFSFFGFLILGILINLFF